MTATSRNGVTVVATSACSSARLQVADLDAARSSTSRCTARDQDHVATTEQAAAEQQRLQARGSRASSMPATSNGRQDR